MQTHYFVGFSNGDLSLRQNPIQLQQAYWSAEGPTAAFLQS